MEQPESLPVTCRGSLGGGGSTQSTRWGRPGIIAYTQLSLFLLLLGIGCRVALYLLNHPMYMDESYLAVNLIDRDFWGLTQQLEENQVAPILFLWVERLALLVCGPAEWSLRLIPFLAGTAALVLFWSLARRVVSPPAAAVAVGLLAVSRWPLHMTCQCKPYSLDLLSAVVLLYLSLTWLRRPEQLRWLFLLVLVVPLAVGLSYPSVFVGGGVALALLPAVWRQGWTARSLFALYAVLLIGSFLVFDVAIGQRQFGSPGNHVRTFMTGYWTNAFPPYSVLPLAKWMMLTHTGPLLGYPYGNGLGSGAVLFLFFVIGIYGCWRTGRRRLLVVCLVPFVLTLGAAFLRKYPYGGCCRLSQHLSPAICLLSGVGFAQAIRLTCKHLAMRRLAVYSCGSLLAAFAMGLVIHWVCCPYRNLGDPWAKAVATGVLAHARPGDRVDCSALPESMRCSTQWYLRIHGIFSKKLDTKPQGGDPHDPGRSAWLLCAGGRPPIALAAPAQEGGQAKPNVEHRATFNLPGRVPVDGLHQAALWAVIERSPGRIAGRSTYAAEEPGAGVQVTPDR